MEKLPILALRKIFSYLTLQEKLRCKLVSKSLKSAVEADGPRSLCIYSGARYPYNEKWDFLERNVTYEEIVFSNHKKNHDFSAMITLFRDLEELFLFFVCKFNDFIVRELPLLSQLKVLVIDNPAFNENHKYEHLTFNSSSLEKLSFKCPGFDDFKSIEFNTPNLNSLVLWINENASRSFKLQLKFSCPLKVRHLECFHFIASMRVLKNLETLNCQKIVCQFALEKFELLGKLELFPREESEFGYIRELIRDKKILRRENLEITVCGFKDLLVSVHRSSGEIFNLKQPFLDQAAKHHENLTGRVPWMFRIGSLELKEFDQIFKGEIRELFLRTFTIESIYLDARYFGKMDQHLNIDQNSFLQLLTEANPKSVTILSCDFNQEFYQHLATIKSITSLDILEKSKNLDLDQFLKLEYLSQLKIHTDKMPIAFIRKVLEMSFLLKFSFRSSYFSMILSRRGAYTFHLSVSTKKLFTPKEYYDSFDTLDGLIENLERVKIENRTSSLGRSLI